MSLWVGFTMAPHLDKLQRCNWVWFSCDNCWDYNRSRPKTTSTWVAYVDAIKFANIENMTTLTRLQIKRGVHIIVRMVKMVIYVRSILMHGDYQLPIYICLCCCHMQKCNLKYDYHTNNQNLCLNLGHGWHRCEWPLL